MQYRENVLRGPGWSPSSIETRLSYDQARQNLQSVRARLSHTIKDYIAACELVEYACSEVLSAGSLTSAPRQQALQATYEELEALSLEQSRIKKARYILKNICNRGEMVAPIYSLPSEILARIFSETTCQCAHEFECSMPSGTSPVELSAVCRQWRKIAFNHRPLWTHIDLVALGGGDVNTYYSPQAWLEHSRGLPLHIRLIQCRALDCDDIRDNAVCDCNECSPEWNIRPLLRFLSPLMPQVCSLDLVFRWSGEDMCNKLLDLWVTRGTPRQAKRLSIKSRLMHNFLDLHPSNHDSLESNDNQHFNELFSSLKALHLRYCTPSWSDIALENLVALELKPGSQWKPPMSSVASILSSCPRLQYLTLDDIYFDNVSDPAPNPVSLRELRVLTLGNEFLIEEVGFLLTLIQPGPTPLHLSVFIGDTALATLKVIRSFLDRWNVTTLHLHCHSYFPCFATMIGSLSRVETLIVESCYFSQNAHPTRPIPNPLAINTEHQLWPQARNLYLRWCILEKNHLCSLVALHSLQRVYMWECFEAPEATDGSKIGIEASQGYVKSLLELVPNVAYFEDEASSWPLFSN